jgi:hypothetical protein
VKGLPPDSAVFREANENWAWGTAEGQWTTAEELLATLIEVVDQGNRLVIMANTKKGTRVPDPIEIPRPYDRAHRRLSTIEEQRKFFAGAVVTQREGDETVT